MESDNPGNKQCGSFWLLGHGEKLAALQALKRIAGRALDVGAKALTHKAFLQMLQPTKR